jgi:hypothetical protein
VLAKQTSNTETPRSESVRRRADAWDMKTTFPASRDAVVD